jgi:8-oxo-dGTP pyrophosphatase MutT (NUDIX family)
MNSSTDMTSPHNSKAPPVRQITTRTAYENRWMTVREDVIERGDGTQGTYSVIDKPHFALIIPLEDDGFHLVEQYRYPIQRNSLEFPQGTYPEGKDGEPVELAREELAEETGLQAANMEHLGLLFNANGMSSQGFHVFLATGLSQGQPAREPEEQDMQQRWASRTQFEHLIRSGIITDAPTISAYALLALRSRVGL